MECSTILQQILCKVKAGGRSTLWHWTGEPRLPLQVVFSVCLLLVVLADVRHGEELPTSGARVGLANSLCVNFTYALLQAGSRVSVPPVPVTSQRLSGRGVMCTYNYRCILPPIFGLWPHTKFVDITVGTGDTVGKVMTLHAWNIIIIILLWHHIQ